MSDDKCGLCKGKGYLPPVPGEPETNVRVICPWCKGKKKHKSAEPKPK